jgi:glycosyltransferase involved in cell wall biosynthesis
VKVRVIDYVGNLGSGLRVAGQVARGIRLRHPEVDFELVSHGRGIGTYWRLQNDPRDAWKVVDIPPSGYARNVGDRNIAGIRGGWRLWRAGEKLGLRYPLKWSFDVPAAALCACEVAWFPFAHVHRVADSCDTSRIVATFHDATYPVMAGLVESSFGIEEEMGTARWHQSKARLVASSQATAHELSAALRTPEPQFTVIPPSGEHARRWFGLKLPRDWACLHDPYLLYSAHRSPQKNHEVLFRGIADWGFRHPLVLSGPDWLTRPPERSSRLSSFAASLGFEAGRSLIELGHVDDSVQAALVANAWALVSPALSPDIGIAPLEALACGVPVVCADVPIMRERLEPASEAVLWFDAHDPFALARRLHDLEQDYDAYKAHAIDRRDECCPRTWQDVADAYWRLFTEVASKTSATSEPPSVRNAFPYPEQARERPLHGEEMGIYSHDVVRAEERRASSAGPNPG